MANKSCMYPGCPRPVESTASTGRPASYCANPTHTAQTAWRERKRQERQPVVEEASPTLGDLVIATAEVATSIVASLLGAKSMYARIGELEQRIAELERQQGRVR